ncbi:Nuclear exosome regulator NRDE2 like protein [Verticillium longisporum]|nr:Nuclear exosome regulator NRDE2 like protein [Verticillium longisporum]
MDEEFSIRRPGQGTSALKDRHLFAKVRHTKPRRIRVRKDATASSGEEDFVPLSQAKNRRHEHDASASEDEAMVYRSIEGKAKAHQYSDSELEYDSSDAGELRFDDDDPARKKSIELSRRVKEHPNDIEAWLALISHQDVLLQNIQDSGGEATEAEVRSFAEIKLSIASAISPWLAEVSWYRELAVAAWQAVLELNLNRPSTLSDASSTEVMDQFKDFWESEVARIGEDSAQGWAHYVQQDGLLDAPDLVAHPIHRSKSRNVYQAWGATEHVHGQQARLPARSMDEGVEDDPYRIVIFSDLENLIFCVPGALITTLRKQLVDAFLLFCHLPPADGSNGWIKAAMNDPHVVGSLHGLRSELLRKPAQHNPDEDDAKRLPIFDYDAHQLRASFDCVFASQRGPVPLSWTANAVRQVVNTAAAESLAQYSLALDWINDPANVKKRARALLKQFPRNLRLYLAYALAEERNGNLDVARQVLVSSAGLAKAPSTDSESKLVFWTTWSWMELEAGQRASAILCLCALADGSAMPDPEVTITPHQLLITQQTLRGNLGYNTPASEAESTALNAGALILCEYLTVGGGSESASLMQGNISTAMDRVWSVSEGLSKCGFAGQAAHEVLLQSAARLLYFHARQGPFRSAYLREQLAKCLGIFPRNTMFLSLFAWASSSFGIDDPVGDMLRSTALANQNDCVSSRIFAITYELQRGNSHSTRAAFEQALKSPACRANSELWRCYVQFSHSRKELRAKAKDNFFRGLGQCPWSKDLAMEAFTTLANVMDEFELGSVFNTMQSKGLRLHVELDEFLAAQGRETGRR